MTDQLPRRVIAVVTDAYAPFHREILDQLWPRFSDAGYGTLAIAGRDVRTDRLREASTSSHAEYRGAFGTRLDVRGAVVVCGATPPGMSEGAINRYVSDLADGPVVSLGIGLPGVPSVTIGWDQAISDLLEHMTSAALGHRFVFIRGYAGDPHSELREAGFRAGMAAAGYVVDERLIVQGNFSVGDSLLAVDALLRDGLRFDGVIAGNDDMAVGAIAALTAHGIRVPGDVVVAGFDDADAAFSSEPPLTTVLLDTEHLAAASADVLIRSIESGIPLPPDLLVTLPSGLITRRSSHRGDLQTRAPQCAPSLEESLTRSLLSRWEARRVPLGLDAKRFAEAAVAMLARGDITFSDAGAAACERLAAANSPADVAWMRHACKEIRAVAMETPADVVSERGLRALLDELAAIEDCLRPIEMQRHTETEAHRHMQERLLMRLASCSDRASLWEALRAGLRSLGMANAWVVANDPTAAHGERSGVLQLMFSLDHEAIDNVEPFDPADVLPPPFAETLADGMHVLVPLRAGVSDIGYMVVEPHGEHLLELEAVASAVAQVLRHLRQVEDLERQAEDLHRANEALDRLARQDSLTGLANRKLMTERLEEHVAGLGPDEKISLLFIDLDGFKRINDTLGHSAGDQLLRLIATRLGATIDPDDTLARLGGDEFTIILRDHIESERFIEVARAALEVAAQPWVIAGDDVQVSASLGIAQYPAHAGTADELMRNADAAMYVAKASGRNRYEQFIADDPPSIAPSSYSPSRPSDRRNPSAHSPM